MFVVGTGTLRRHWLRIAAPAFLIGTPAALAHAQAPVDARVEALLRRMTLEEKVGEMTQLDISAVTRVAGTATRAQVLDSAKLEEIVVHRNVGALLNVAGVALTPKQWADINAMIQRFAARRRVHVPVLYGIDAVHGHQYMLGATIFPQNIAMAATWNPMLVRRANQITAYETRAERHRLEFLAGARPRAAAALVALLRDLRRGRLPHVGARPRGH